MIENTEKEVLKMKAEMTSDEQEQKEVIEENLKPEKPGIKYTDEDFQKSRNSRTAALFQRHGKLLDDPKAGEEKKEARGNKKSCWSSCFLCCCREKNPKKPVDSKQSQVKSKKTEETETKKSCCLFCCSRKKDKRT